jgi:glycosyltransferase involved in cell wall biosynthesis
LKISVITVCFNSEKTIENTIKSVLLQDYENIEYIIIDGCSSDNTMSLISNYNKEIDLVISEKDNGIYDAINKGISHANGDYIVILNSNDVFYSLSTIADIVNFHTINNCSISIGDVIYMNKFHKLKRYYSARFWFPFFLNLGFMPPHQGLVIKASLFKEFGNYSLLYKIASDYELVVRFILKNKVDFKYSQQIRVIMSDGGISSQGITSYTFITKEIISILKIQNNFILRCIVSVRFLPKFISSTLFKLYFILK